MYIYLYYLDLNRSNRDMRTNDEVHRMMCLCFVYLICFLSAPITTEISSAYQGSIQNFTIIETYHLIIL